MKKIAIRLPFFNPPKEDYEFHGVAIKTATLSDIQNKYIGRDMGCFGGEWFELIERRFGKGCEIKSSRWAIIVREDTEISDTCYIGILDMLTKHWKYVLKRNKMYRKPIDLSDLSGNSIKLNPPIYNFTKTLLKNFEKGVKLVATNKRFRIALRRWISSYDRTDPLDSVLDCCSALESVLSCQDEIRLRISLSVFHILKTEKRKSMIKIYEMYGLRNDFIHGSKIPKITIDEQHTFIKIVSDVLYALIKKGKVPNKPQLDQKIIENYA